jgi:hypothetical protein
MRTFMLCVELGLSHLLLPTCIDTDEILIYCPRFELYVSNEGKRNNFSLTMHPDIHVLLCWGFFLM